MTALFADTFYWIALVDFSDSAHQRALALTLARIDAPIVTTDEVLAEYLTFFATGDKQLRREAVLNAHRILEDPGVRVVPQSRDSLLSGMALYGARPDKGYSLVSMRTDAAVSAGGVTFGGAATSFNKYEMRFFCRPVLPGRRTAGAV
jgi:predicted nucleic acid-binding protein